MSKAEELARQFHEIYERLAPEFGYQTREMSQVFDATSKNGQLMIATCGEILDRFAPGMFELDDPHFVPSPVPVMEEMILLMSPYLKTLERNSKVAVIAKMAAILTPDTPAIAEDVALHALDLYNACAAIVQREIDHG